MRYINILTIHKEPNYGACLQAYALYKKIEELGGHSRMIDLSMDYRAHPYNFTYRGLTSMYQHLRGYDYCYKKATEFSEKYCPTRIGPFYTYEQLTEYKWDPQDMFIVGSDQVWNDGITQNLKNAYTFSFLPDSCTNRYTYASSFGNITNEEDRIQKLDLLNVFPKFKRISVRERFGKEFLLKSNINSEVVIDPTLLIEDYTFLLKDKITHSGNLLYLPLGDNTEMDAFVKEVSSTNGLPVEKRYGYLQPSRTKNHQWLSVESWLQRIASAEMVFTDSFHAMVFSIMFEKPFYIFVSNPNKVFRIGNLLKSLGLEQRIVDDVRNVKINEVIDYAHVKHILAQLRKDSLSYLSAILKDYENSIV